LDADEARLLRLDGWGSIYSGIGLVQNGCAVHPFCCVVCTLGS